MGTIVFHCLSLRLYILLFSVFFFHPFIAEKRKKQIGDGIKMKTILIFLLAMIVSISGKSWYPNDYSHENGKVEKRIQKPAHIAEDFFGAKDLHGKELPEGTPHEKALRKCSSAVANDEQWDEYVEWCNENNYY